METKHGQHHGGKGSLPRPTDRKKFEENWDRIFGKKKKDEEEFDKNIHPMVD